MKVDDDGKIKELRKICDSIQVDRKALKDYSFRKGISSMDVDRFIREGAFIDDGTGHFVTNEDYKTSDSPRRSTPTSKPDPESKSEKDENEIESETTYVRKLKPAIQPESKGDSEEIQSKYAPITVKGVEIPSCALEKLGPNQHDHLALIAAGKSQEEICEKLHIRTAKGFRRSTDMLNQKLRREGINIDLSVDGENVESLNKVSTVKEKRGDIDMTTDSSPKIKYADIAVAIIAAGITEITEENKEKVRVYVRKIHKKSGASEESTYSRASSFIDYADSVGLVDLAKKGNIDNITKYLPKQKDLEELTEERPVPADTMEESYTSPIADIAAGILAYTNIRNLEKQNIELTTAVKEIRVANGSPEKNALGYAHQFVHKARKTKGGLKTLAEGGNAEAVKNYFEQFPKPMQEFVGYKPKELPTIEDKDAQGLQQTTVPAYKMLFGDDLNKIMNILPLDKRQALEEKISEVTQDVAKMFYELGVQVAESEQQRVDAIKQNLEAFKKTYKLKD
jgi:hypothetical protein